VERCAGWSSTGLLDAQRLCGCNVSTLVHNWHDEDVGLFAWNLQQQCRRPSDVLCCDGRPSRARVVAHAEPFVVVGRACFSRSSRGGAYVCIGASQSGVLPMLLLLKGVQEGLALC